MFLVYSHLYAISEIEKRGETMKQKISTAFLRGFIKSIDIGATTKKEDELNNYKFVDCEALSDDWKETGQEIRRQIQSYAR